MSTPQHNAVPTEFADGAWSELPFETYLSADGVSKSLLDKVRKAPAKARHYLDNIGDEECKPSQTIGRRVHSTILEPWTLRWAIRPATYPDSKTGEPKPWNTNANFCKQWEKEQRAEGLEPISQKELDQIQGMAESVHAHPVARQLLNKSNREVSFWATHEPTGLQRKCRIDIVPPADALADLKTCEDASYDAIRRDVQRYRYHVQAAYYSDMYNDLMQTDQRHKWFNVFVEKKPPYLCAVYELTNSGMSDIIQRGRELYESDMQTLAKCMETGEWPGYFDGVIQLEILKWWDE